MEFFRKLKWLAQRRRKEDELSEELQFHLEEEAERHRAEGASAEEALWAARRRPERVRRATVNQRWWLRRRCGRRSRSPRLPAAGQRPRRADPPIGKPTRSARRRYAPRLTAESRSERGA